MRAMIDAVRARLGTLEPALFIALAGRMAQSLAGLGTLFFVIRYFTPVEQGYYQTFLSLIALQSFLELGILIAVVSVVSHEWAGLARDPKGAVLGDIQKVARLADATRFVVVWFGGAALLFLLVGGVVGFTVLSQHGNPSAWAGPWLVVIAFAAITFWGQGLVALLEGCNAITSVASYRLVMGLVSAFSLWLAVASGAGLWALAVQLAANLICTAAFLARWHGRFLVALVRARGPSTFNWRADIWPMQWPLALQGVTSYFYFSLFVPALFTFEGPVEAGRLGLTLQVLMALLSVASALVTVRLPQLGTRFAGGDVAGFEQLWRRTTALSVGLIALGALTVGVAVWSGDRLGLPFIGRFAAPLPFTVLLVWTVGLNVMQCIAAYWRAQRREPVGWWGALPGLATGAAVWILGQRYGALGASLGALTVFATITAPSAIYFFRQSMRHIRGDVDNNRALG